MYIYKVLLANFRGLCGQHERRRIMKQIIPCNVEMYAIYEGGNEEFKERIIAFGLDGEGYFRPLAFSADMGADYADEPCNFLRYELEERDRIADVLEDINGALISMGGDIEALGDCVGTIPARYTQGIDVHFLRIGGSVDTGV